LPHDCLEIKAQGATGFPDSANNRENDMPYLAPESVRCDCCGNDVGCGEHEAGCANEPTDLAAIEALAACWWPGREAAADVADDNARIDALAARYGAEGGV
jgi:hypothetical protein